MVLKHRVELALFLLLSPLGLVHPVRFLFLRLCFVNGLNWGEWGLRGSIFTLLSLLFRSTRQLCRQLEIVKPSLIELDLPAQRVYQHDEPEDSDDSCEYTESVRHVSCERVAAMHVLSREHQAEDTCPSKDELKGKVRPFC